MQTELAQAHPPPPPPEAFDAGEVILGHVSNSSHEHPLIHLPKIFGIDFSVTKHVLMLWVVAGGLFLLLTWIVRRYARTDRQVPDKLMSVLEIGVEFVRNNIIEPYVGHHWAKTWTPLLLSIFVFVLFANAIGLVPIFDVLALADHYLIHSPEGSFFKGLLHGGSTVTGNFNVTAGLAMVSFFTIMIAGTRQYGFFTHLKNLVPKGLPWPIYFLLVPIEILGLLVRPFALTMRLAANMTGGHIAVLAILSFVFIFTEMLGTSVAGIGIGLGFSVPLAAAVSGLEIIVVLVQAYVFTLLSAVFVGMAVHADH